MFTSGPGWQEMVLVLDMKCASSLRLPEGQYRRGRPEGRCEQLSLAPQVGFGLNERDLILNNKTDRLMMTENPNQNLPENALDAILNHGLEGLPQVFSTLITGRQRERPRLYRGRTRSDPPSTRPREGWRGSSACHLSGRK